MRASVPAAIAEAQAAGIRVVMVTGDYQATALRIAAQAGLETQGGTISGLELDRLSDAELGARARSANIFSRVTPEQKLRLVNALKARREIVAMTGDGVNDAPALKAAHIGIAMGNRGTDVAREAAALVLLDDDFSSIVQAVRLGRRIFDNLRKAIVFVVAAHVPIIGMSVIPVALGWPLALMPVHILFLQLIIDPACSIVFEAEPEESRHHDAAATFPAASLFGWPTLATGVLQGVFALFIVAVMYGLVLQQGKRVEEARALAFTTLVVAGLWPYFRRPHTVRQSAGRACHAQPRTVVGLQPGLVTPSRWCWAVRRCVTCSTSNGCTGTTLPSAYRPASFISALSWVARRMLPRLLA